MEGESLNAQLTDGGPSARPELSASEAGPPFGAAAGWQSYLTSNLALTTAVISFSKEVVSLIPSAEVAVTPFGLICITPILADRKSTRLNSSHRCISYAVFCLK